MSERASLLGLGAFLSSPGNAYGFGFPPPWGVHDVSIYLLKKPGCHRGGLGQIELGFVWKAPETRTPWAGTRAGSVFEGRFYNRRKTRERGKQWRHRSLAVLESG